MLILRLKQAEHAMAGGRLEEAYSIVCRPGVREHRRGQDLTIKLVKLITARAREHLEADRLLQAAADCELARKLAGNDTELASVQLEIQSALKARQRAERRNAGLLEAARQQVLRGQLSVGAKLLAGVDEPEPGADLLLREMEARRAKIDAMVLRIESAFGRGDWDMVVDQLAAARADRCQDERIRQLAHKTASILLRRARSVMDEGRLELADALLHRLARFVDSSIELQELRGSLAQCRSAWQFIERGQPDLAEPILRRLQHLMPDAQWLRNVMADVQLAAQAAHRLRGAPLAVVENIQSAGEHAMHRPSPAEETPLVLPHVPQKPPGYRLPPRLVLAVDGVGSFLVLMQSKLTVASIGASGLPDLAIAADPATPPIRIERIEEDYFLRASGPIIVNDRPVKEKLLVSGDRIAASPKVRLVFRRPNPASTTALLDLGATRIGRADVRNVILMDREIVIGPGGAVHVRCDGMPHPVVLIARGEELICQAKEDVIINDSPVGRSAVVPVGATVQVGETRFAVAQG